MRFIDARIEALDELIDRTRSRLYGSKSSGLSGMPGGGKGGDWTNLVARIETLEAEKRELEAELERAKTAIKGVSDSKWRTAAELYYIRGYAEPKISLAMGVELRTVQRWKENAIRELERKFTGKM